MKVAVVGGGIAGLATALAVRDCAAAAGARVEVSVLEASPRLGGNIRSEKSDGYTVEWGPNGFLDNVPATLALVSRLGLDPELQPADPSAANRFLYRRGKLRLLPGGPLSFFASSLLSLRGRLRVVGEPWTRPKAPGLDETVHAFAARHLGEEAAAILVDAMVSGVFAGNSRELSLTSAFPKMAAMESAHGSLVRAMIAKGRERRAAKQEIAARRARGEAVADLERAGGPAGPGGTLTSFRGGLETWIDALASELGTAIETERAVVALRRVDDPNASSAGSAADVSQHRTTGEHRAIAASQFTAGSRSASGRSASWELELTNGERRTADAVVLAIPASRAVPLLAPLDAALSATLGEIPAAGLAVVALAFDAATLGGAPRGFGFLVPRGEGLRILGCLWDSSIFPGRAPAGKVLLRAMIGGAHDPAAVGLDDAELVGIVRSDLERAMGLRAEPERVWIFRHPLGIGQYTVGHGARLERIAERLSTLPGLHVAGQSYFGISMNACIEKAQAMAAALSSPAV